MGLPLFRTPVEPEVVSKTAEKIASSPRSSIRRERPQRGPHARMVSEIRRRRLLGILNSEPDYDPEAIERQPERQTAHDELASTASLQQRAMQMFEQERMRLRDPLSYERQRLPAFEADGLPMPAVPESRDYTGVEERHREINRLRQVRSDLRRMARRRPAPTPPYTDSDYVNIRTEPGVSSPRPSSSLARALSPSLQPLSTDISDASTRRSLEDSDFSFTGRGPITADSTRIALSTRVQALNRMSGNLERSRRLIRQARMDGLGDRDRSLSPDGGAAWDTLLTSITPDPQPPSAGSSFASAAVATSSSSGSGPTSASTSMTSIDRSEEPPTVRDCDVSDSGSNTEDEDDMYELQEFGRNRPERIWRAYADAVTTRAERSSLNISTDTELGGMHRIISRLAERDEIPEEWWLSAGLSRNLRREP